MFSSGMPSKLSGMGSSTTRNFASSAGNQLPVGVRHAAIEQAHGRERTNVSHEAGRPIGVLVLGQIAETLDPLAISRMPCKKGCAVAAVAQKLVGDGFVEFRPTKSLLDRESQSRTALSSWANCGSDRCPEACFEREGDQARRTSSHRAARATPTSGRCKSTTPGRLDLVPVHPNMAAVVHVLGDRTDRLDRHDGDSRGRDCRRAGRSCAVYVAFHRDPVAGPHRSNEVEVPVLVSVFPNPLGQEARRAGRRCRRRPRPRTMSPWVHLSSLMSAMRSPVRIAGYSKLSSDRPLIFSEARCAHSRWRGAGCDVRR